MTRLEHCVKCFGVSKAEDLALVPVNYDDRRLCPTCAVPVLSSLAVRALDPLEPRNFHALRLMADAWDVVGRQLRRIEEHEGRKAAHGPVAQLPAPKEIAHG